MNEIERRKIYNQQFVKQKAMTDTYEKIVKMDKRRKRNHGDKICKSFKVIS